MAHQGIKLLTGWTTAVMELVSLWSIGGAWVGQRVEPRLGQRIDACELLYVNNRKGGTSGLV